jgi:hypothetical protein
LTTLSLAHFIANMISPQPSLPSSFGEGKVSFAPIRNLWQEGSKINFQEWQKNVLERKNLQQGRGLIKQYVELAHHTSPTMTDRPLGHLLYRHRHSYWMRPSHPGTLRYLRSL